MIIKNDRLKIEKFTISDAFFWSKIDSNPKVRHFVDGKKQTYSQSVAYIKKNISSYEKSGFGRYIVRLRKNNEVIGMCGYLEENYGIDFGYRYTPSVWGKGIGFEVAKLVLKFGIKDLKFQKIYALSHVENYGSIRILEKLNFKKQNIIVINSQHAILFVLKVERN